MKRICLGLLLVASISASVWSQDLPIHRAAAEGDLAAIAAALKADVNSLNARGTGGKRPLHLAIAGDGAAVSLLLAKGADPNAVDDKGQSPLHLACSALEDERAAHLVNVFRLRKANLNLADSAGDTPLHLAARGGKTATADALLRAGADANPRNKKGALPLEEAAALAGQFTAEHPDDGFRAGLVMLLMMHTNDVRGVKVRGQPLELYVVRFGTLEHVQGVLQRKGDVHAKNSEGETLLQIASAAGDASRVALLAAWGADVNAADTSGRSALHGAAWDGRLELVDVLLTAGARADGGMAASRVSGSGSASTTPLHAAAWQGHAAVARLLLAHGAAPDVRDSDGATPLHKAAWQGHAEVVGQLLAAGADARAKNADGFTALDHAASRLKDEEKRVAAIKRSWGQEQAAGPPDTPNPGDQGTAWASASADGQDEWLQLSYPKAVVPARIDVHENHSPGAVVKITAVHDDGREVEVWSGTDPTPVGSASGISKIAIDTKHETNRIKLYIASAKVAGWNEIDAVGLIDAKGETQWAARVTASSTYASGPDATNKFAPVVELLQAAKK